MGDYHDSYGKFNHFWGTPDFFSDTQRRRLLPSIVLVNLKLGYSKGKGGIMFQSFSVLRSRLNLAGYVRSLTRISHIYIHTHVLKLQTEIRWIFQLAMLDGTKRYVIVHLKKDPIIARIVQHC